MAKQIEEFKEGFWKNSYEQDLPMPVANAEPWKSQQEFLILLDEVETEHPRIEKACYCGISWCRICNKHNGSREFSLVALGVKWVWPAGFAHYVRVHNVEPSIEFRRFIRAVTDCRSK